MSRSIAGAMKTLGYVNMYNRGIGQVQDELLNNGNPAAIFNVNLVTAFSVEVQKSNRLDENQQNAVLELLKNIGSRTNSDIYVGVVGPVRVGKSTFIK